MKTALTIGFFDGVHLGHQYLLKHLSKLPHPTILTFTTHPKAFFNPPAPRELTPYPERICRLQSFATRLEAVPFDKKLANTTFEELLSHYNLSHLILGKGAVFGKDRKGTEEAVREYAKSRGFTVEYLEPYLINNEPVSSSRIRKALADGDETLAKQLLGRS